MSVLDLVCPVCKVSNFDSKYLDDGLYVCANYPHGEDGGQCKTIVAIYCKKCGKIIDENRLGLRGDVYECKNCGTAHWGYTEYKRERAVARKYLENYKSSMLNIIDSLKKY